MNRLAIDFGTSNSAAAVHAGGAVRRLPIEDGAETLPTAVFFPEGGGAMRIGAAAGAALIGGEEGRYMRALKSVLGVPLLHEKRLIEGKRRTLAEVVTAFLVQVRERSESFTGARFTRALSGRPVRFHEDVEKDARAEDDLRGCYMAAGFEEVEFLPEPEAAARACQGMGGAEGLGLIVDIGGGTSDFTVFRSGAEVEILASYGLRLGGTDFDRVVSVAEVMPLLGLGGELRREFGPGLLPVPAALFVDLATWPKIPFLYTADTRRKVAQMLKLAEAPEVLGRLAKVLEDELGHELAFAVERGKIAANDAGAGRIGMGFVSPGLAAELTAARMDGVLDAARESIGGAVREVLVRAGVGPGDVARVILVGGSSLMGFVGREAAAVCGGAEVLRSEAFTAVVDGLALAAAE
ncbi:Hsp70 family protein [Oceanicola sp. 502str15]|uniref:Hsp70 family protein n=1 Tax=Oceanicola sp. 502str15 TaxID=2696061 RepID=UPI0020961379|nr:Hsp70 family protein [Oceanicola sp. 502str15]MCO6383087.1 Hsp70 family protein [Oceanicola sp. 502str15]